MTVIEARPGVYVLQRERPAEPCAVEILADRCAGCQECVVRCPAGALSIEVEPWIAVADAPLCVGCRQCERTCPFSAIVVSGPPAVAPRTPEHGAHYDELLGDVGEVRLGFSSFEEMVAEAARCLACPDPTCVRGCPAHNDIPGFIAAARAGDLDQAHQVLRRTTVLPDVCSRVCDQASQCEGACSWNLAGAEPVAIGRIERYIADHADVPPPRLPRGRDQRNELSVAIIGAGPAGIAAAWQLVEAGASVTVYEKDEEPGGLCDWGIPDFTLPASIAGRPWRQLVAAGVDLRLGHEVDSEELARLGAEHDAVLLANGAGRPIRLSVPGAELAGVTDATAFLKAGREALAAGGGLAALRAMLGEAVLPERVEAPRVLVLGAGNTAMDVARTARRLGMEARCIDWLDEAYALARPDELAEARAEGVEVRFSSTLQRLDGDGVRVTRARLQGTVQTRPDRQPTVLADRVEDMAVDLVVMAMGYRLDPDLSSPLGGKAIRREATGVADRSWSASGLLRSVPARPGRKSVGQLALGREAGVEAATLPVGKRMWLAGDALVGPSTVVEAMAQGRRAAAAILQAGPVRRPGSPAAQRRSRVLVVYESQGGTTARAAQLIGRSFSEASTSVRVLPIARVGVADLVAADLVVLGTWVEGKVVARVRPAAAMREWLARLHHLAGVEVGLFCTYAVAPGGALGELTRALEDKGASVVGQAAFNRRVVGSSRGVVATVRFAADLEAATSIRRGSDQLAG